MIDRQAQLIEAIIALAEAYGVIAVRQAGGTVVTREGETVRLGPAGVPRLLLVLPQGSIVWLTVTPADRVTPAQVVMRERLQQLGHMVHQVRSVSEVIELLEQAPGVEAP